MLKPPRSLDTASLDDAVRALGRQDPDLAAAVRRFGSPPLWARPPGFSSLVKIILEQQVTLASGKAVYKRLQKAAGAVTPHRVARLSEARIRRAGLTRQKAAYCRNLAVRIVGGVLSLPEVSDLDDDAVRERLLQVPGIGPWTADIYLLMCLGRPDIWPDGDLALARAMQQVKRLRKRPDAERQRTIAAGWSPWRSVGARILWHSYLSSLHNGHPYP